SISGSLDCVTWFRLAAPGDCLHESRMREIFSSGSTRGAGATLRLLHRHFLSARSHPSFTGGESAVRPCQVGPIALDSKFFIHKFPLGPLASSVVNLQPCPRQSRIIFSR